jgi:streptogramin lyase
MKRTVIVFATLWAGTSAFAQRPSNPALMVPQNAPELDYMAVDDPIALPAGTTIGAPASVAFDSKGHMFILNRGPQPLMEFDANRKFIRTVGELTMTRAHGMRIDRDDNIWVTDVGAHVVMKLNPQGQILLTLGRRDRQANGMKRPSPAT